MTDKEIKIAKDKLYKSIKERLGVNDLFGMGNKWTEEEKRLDAELSAREMMSSHFAYDFNLKGFYDKETGKWGRYALRYVEKLGEERLKELVEEQEETYSHCRVKTGVYTDYEGCSYNSIEWGVA